VVIMLGSIGLDIWATAVYRCLEIVIYGRASMSKMLCNWWCRITRDVHWTSFRDDDAFEHPTALVMQGNLLDNVTIFMIKLKVIV